LLSRSRSSLPRADRAIRPRDHEKIEIGGSREEEELSVSRHIEGRGRRQRSRPPAGRPETEVLLAVEIHL
jgi:hypothetical protein